MTVSFRLILLLGVAALATNGCATRDRKAAQVSPSAPVLLVGTIALVNSDSGFVLIDQGQQASPTAGALLKTFNGGTESAVLVASDVRKRPFIIADIKSGTPQKGDRVFIPTVIPAPAATPEMIAPTVAGAAPMPDALPQLSPAGEVDQ